MAAIEQSDCNHQLDLDITKESCFRAAQAIEATVSTSFLVDILMNRLSIAYSLDPSIQSLSIDSCIKTKAYCQALQTDIPTWPEEFNSLEKLAIQCFGHWPAFWCEYEIYKIKQRYPSDSAYKSSALLIDENLYQSEIVEEIATSNKLYLSLHHFAPMPLNDAIALINLSTLVSVNKWYEILPKLDISRQGSHFILTYPNSNDQDTPSTIVSSARIQGWKDAQHWLYFTSFFRNHYWQLCLPNNLNERCFELGLFDAKFDYNGSCNQHFEDNFSSHIQDKEQICEVLRLTVSGTTTQGAFFLFLAQKRIMPYLADRNFKLAYTVIEQPWMIRFYETLKYGGYFHSSFRHVENSINNTYKGFWVIPSLRYELEDLDYQSYKHRVIGRIREVKEIDYV
ncbi:acyl-homoserine-lactone synthase [Vibrio kyushuensis]|uniref:acyl-homoserine-lactone synthase n=1 Tax=Vibrio kyushuensis TaxID=2910249 RepID=UPI003D0B5BD6